MIGLFRALLVLVCAAMTAGAATAQARPNCEMLVDASGSMEGFYWHKPRALPSGERVYALRPLLERLRHTCSRASLFDLRPRLLAAGEAFSVGRGDTDIAGSLQTWSDTAADGTFLILVTDNVEDTTSEGDGENARFYNLLRLRSSVFSHITVLAFRAPFSGYLYLPGTPGPAADYTGPRALSIYLLGKGTGGHAADYDAMRDLLRTVFERTGRAEFEAGSGNLYPDYVLFDVRPFAREAISLTARPVSMAESRGPGSQCARTGFDPKKGFYLYDQKMEVRCEVRALISVRIPRRWCLNQASLRAHAFVRRGSDDRLLQDLEARVSPAVADLCSEAQELTTTLVFSPVTYRKDVDFGDRFRRSFKQGGAQAQGQLTVEATFERAQVNIADSIGQAWNLEEVSAIATPHPSVQSRVFKLDRAVRSIVPDDALSSTEILSYDVHIGSRYEQWPLLVLLAAGLAGLALLAFLIVLARRPLLLLADGGAGDEFLRLPLLASGRVESAADDLHVTFTNLGALLFARSNGRIRRGRVLPRSGGTIEVVRSRSGSDDPADDGRGAGSPLASILGTTFAIRKLPPHGHREDQYDDGF